MEAAELNVRNEELRTTREVMRELNAILLQLDQGQLEKVVLTRSGKMVGVLISPEVYANLQRS